MTRRQPSTNQGGRRRGQADRQAALPHYLRIAGAIESRILQKTYEANDAIPTFNALAEEFGVSLVTVNKAIQELDNRGLVIRRRGKGVFVAPAGGGARTRPEPPATRRIGLIVPDLANPFFATMAKTIQSILHADDFSVITESTDGSPELWSRHLHRFIDAGVDGLILVPLGTGYIEKEEVLWRLKMERIPFVYLNGWLKRVPSDQVVVDIDQGVRDIARHLVEAGHRDLGCVSAQPYGDSTQRKVDTFREALVEHGIELAEEQVVVSSLAHNEGGKEAALQLLSPRRARPTAIFATNDIIAFGVMAAARQLGLRIPEDVSVVGYDDIEASRLAAPALTTVSQPVKETAAEAARILKQRVEGTLPPDFQELVFHPELLVRESSAPLKARLAKKP